MHVHTVKIYNTNTNTTKYVTERSVKHLALTYCCQGQSEPSASDGSTPAADGSSEQQAQQAQQPLSTVQRAAADRRSRPAGAAGQQAQQVQQQPAGACPHGLHRLPAAHRRLFPLRRCSRAGQGCSAEPAGTELPPQGSGQQPESWAGPGGQRQQPQSGASPGLVVRRPPAAASSPSGVALCSAEGSSSGLGCTTLAAPSGFGMSRFASKSGANLRADSPLIGTCQSGMPVAIRNLNEVHWQKPVTIAVVVFQRYYSTFKYTTKKQVPRTSTGGTVVFLRVDSTREYHYASTYKLSRIFQQNFSKILIFSRTSAKY
jgi:hypothetical protein